jgi:phage gpG-like protein
MIQDTRFVSGAERLGRRIRTLRDRFGLAPFKEELGDLLLARTMRRFDAEVDPDGVPWASLARKTQRDRARLGFDGQKLVRTGKMRDSIQLIRGVGGFYTNTGAGLRIGIPNGREAMIGWVQNHGYGAIPARRFLGVGRLDVKAVDSFLRRRGQQMIDES